MEIGTIVRHPGTGELGVVVHVQYNPDIQEEDAWIAFYGVTKDIPEKYHGKPYVLRYAVPGLIVEKDGIVALRARIEELENELVLKNAEAEGLGSQLDDLEDLVAEEAARQGCQGTRDDFCAMYEGPQDAWCWSCRTTLGK